MRHWAFVVGLLAASSMSHAQMGRDFFPWWDMPLARDLSLSDDQTKQIQTVTREYRDRLVDLRALVEKADNELSDIMDEERPDQTRAYAAIDRLISARSELTRLYSQMAFRLRTVLTPVQWRELQKRRPGPRGPGGPGGPPDGRRFGRPGFEGERKGPPPHRPNNDEN